VRFTNVELLRVLAPRGIGPRRHLAACALVASLLVLVAGLARPSIDTKEPLERATTMLAIDVSLSMQATDVSPTLWGSQTRSCRVNWHLVFDLDRHVLSTRTRSSLEPVTGACLRPVHRSQGMTES
jgi:hypothetical protein